jgi:predicted mannosyl-3-phosphoglycerate phosphatase (HAD superfamily)
MRAVPGAFVFLIPIVAILSGVMREWIRVRARQQALGSSNEEMARELAAMKQEREALAQRLENLEAIVVSQTWDALHDKALPPAERELKVASAARRELAAPESSSNQQRAEQLARRLLR